MAATARKINANAASELVSHNSKLGPKRILKSIGYERTAELSYIVNLLREKFNEPLRYLDVGTGDSVLPSFLLAHSKWDVSCLDKCDWVQEQFDYARRIGMKGNPRLHVFEQDALTFTPEAPFDIITNISVIEHFPTPLDSAAMKHTASLLKPGGLYILTTPMNEGYPKEFYRQGMVYGEKSEGGTYYQRHYDKEGVQKRLIEPTGLREVSRTYFGEYGFQFGEKFMFPAIRTHPWKAAYKWSAPCFSQKFMEYRDEPVSRADMKTDTSSGIILVLQKD
ncbi:methyltransferase domain-containing protein [bacterium]|nr:methyltransferase domain-containing protein [bacterium]